MEVPVKHNLRNGTAVWINTGTFSEIIDAESLSDMFRNAGGPNALRSLASFCILLPMINNGIGISPEYRSIINRLNKLAGEHPEWFHEDLWIQAFQQILDGLTSHADGDDKPTLDAPAQVSQPKPTIPPNPSVQPASEGASFSLNQKDALKSTFDKF
ncbi:MAG: hypothetical protein IBX50_07630 [Marinospirillum sp.]|uniref:hypothetical protein n=1 Tax=Marinospirillum sp. TaxID=2183934 RepID=UPI0019DCECD7|nr:hypothetical protein [Marinospirillum sp.]MBE0506577.1 hypothetical protein [Marinospirillum sp.]